MAVASLLRGLQGWVEGERKTKRNRADDRATIFSNDLLNGLQFSWISLRVLLEEHNAMYVAYTKSNEEKEGGKIKNPFISG